MLSKVIPVPVDSIRRQVAAAVSYRPLSASTFNAAARTVELIAATDTPVRMPGWRIGIEGDFLEILDMSPGAVDLGQVSAGNCPLLDTHNRYELAARLGAITAARVEGSRLITAVQFGESDPARSAAAEFGGQIPPKVSAGYRVSEYQFVRFEADRTPVYKATKWALNEVSLVPIAADANAGVRADAGGAPCIVRGDDGQEAGAANPGGRGGRGGAASNNVVVNVPGAGEGARAEAPALTVSEALLLQDQARTFGVVDQVRAAFEAPGATPDSVRAAILGAAALRQAGNTGGLAAGGAAHVISDQGDNMRSGVETAILLQIGGQPRQRSVRLGQLGEVDARRVDMAAAYRGMTLSELAATVIGERSLPRSVREREEIFARAFHVTSDFPTLLTNALNQRLLENYTIATPIYRRIASQMTFMDFRSHGLLRVGDFPQLQTVNEAGEIKGGTIKDAKKENLSVTAYGIAFNLSRQLLVNDRLGGIEQALSTQGTQVALFEEKTFFNMKGVASGVGPTLNEDSTAVFTSGHGNYTGTGTAISTAALGIGRASLRKIKNLQGDQMGLGPSLLMVSPDKETEAQSVLANISATQPSNVNLFSGKLELIVGGQLTGNAWELYADPSLGANWAWGLLEGYEAPRLKVEDVFGAQGVRVSLEHDFGCGAQDYRFGYRNAGA